HAPSSTTKPSISNIMPVAMLLASHHTTPPLILEHSTSLLLSLQSLLFPQHPKHHHYFPLTAPSHLIPLRDCKPSEVIPQWVGGP
ncbi:hypothetical protein SK128_027283, partial [Halocaridina rubra]